MGQFKNIQTVPHAQSCKWNMFLIYEAISKDCCDIVIILIMDSHTYILRSDLSIKLLQFNEGVTMRIPKNLEIQKWRIMANQNSIKNEQFVSIFNARVVLSTPDVQDFQQPRISTVLSPNIWLIEASRIGLQCFVYILAMILIINHRRPLCKYSNTNVCFQYLYICNSIQSNFLRYCTLHLESPSLKTPTPGQQFVWAGCCFQSIISTTGVQLRHGNFKLSSMALNKVIQ